MSIESAVVKLAVKKVLKPLSIKFWKVLYRRAKDRQAARDAVKLLAVALGISALTSCAYIDPLIIRATESAHPEWVTE